MKKITYGCKFPDGRYGIKMTTGGHDYILIFRREDSNVAVKQVFKWMRDSELQFSKDDAMKFLLCIRDTLKAA